MLQAHDPKDPHRKQCTVLLVASESSLRFLISTFLHAMRCGCVMVSTSQQLADVQHERFDAVLIDMANSSMSAEQAIISLRELHPGLSERIIAFSSGVTKPEMLELIERYGLREISRETLLPQVWATLKEFIAASPTTSWRRGTLRLRS